MGLLNSILGAASGKTDASGEANSLVGVLGGLLTQSGGLQGLASKFSQSGCGGAFASWVGMGENQSISSDQIQKCLGSDQVKTLAERWERSRERLRPEKLHRLNQAAQKISRGYFRKTFERKMRARFFRNNSRT